MYEKEVVSVIIPTYKRPTMLQKSIDSILSQSYKNIEVIVVDDNDSDSKYRFETEKVISKYEGNTKVKYIKHLNNRGANAARNSGINAAQGHYIAFLDDDDEYFPSKIEKQVDKFRYTNFEKLALVYCYSDVYNDKGRIRKKIRNKYVGKPYKETILQTIAGTSAFLIKSNVLKELKGFSNLPCGQDWDVITRIIFTGYEIDVVEEVLLAQYEHGQERITTKTTSLQSSAALIKEKEKYYKYLSDSDIKDVKIANLYFLIKSLSGSNKKWEAVKRIMDIVKLHPNNARSLSYLFKSIISVLIF